MCHCKNMLVEMVSCKDFIYYHRSNFTSLLESGDLTEKSSIQFTPQDSEFPVVLAKVCFYHHFRGKTCMNWSIKILVFLRVVCAKTYL